MSKIWQVLNKLNKEFLEEFPELDPIIAQLLYNRGLKTQEAIDEFLNSDYSQDIHDPALFQDMNKAVSRIFQAIQNKELITIYGDYDADGVCAAVILVTVLTKLGAQVNTYLPHREKEGYGLNQEAIEELAQAKTKIILTCDCGVSNIAEIELAKQKNIDVIITDHHALPEILPQAVAIIHPQVKNETYPFKFLSGGAVAFKLAQALLHNSDLDETAKEINEKWLLDLVAISIVADMVPLLGENRTLLQYGLVVLKKTQRLGLQKLIAVSNLDVDKIDARSIGFSLAPRINAAGRMDHANLAYYLLMEQDQAKAITLANDLNSANLDRQKMTEQIIKEAKELAIDLKDNLLVFYKTNWNPGLTGLVASRLVREYDRPCLVLTDNNGNIVGSGRSIGQFDITQALEENKELLLRFGGHPQACGFLMVKSNLDTFVTKMKTIAQEKLKDIKFEAVLNIEMEVDFTTISWEMVDLLDKFKPFGKDNEEPLFLSQEITISGLRKVGQDAKHLKLELSQGGKKLDAIGFNLSAQEIQLNDKVDLVYNLGINEWNNNRNIQLNIKDIKKHV